ncbi:MAG: FAD-linked oxidase C-terminal domain-containing protein [Promethearchaeota archaeon]
MPGEDKNSGPNGAPESPYGPVDDEFKREVEGVVDPRRVFWSFLDRYAYAYDGTLYNGKTVPEGVVLVETREEARGLMEVCSRFRVPVTARGGGSSLSGAPLSTVGGLILDFSAMDRVLEVDAANSVVVVEPGVNCDDLNARLAEEGFFFPPDPGSSSIATIGGMVANNSGGVQALKYGVTQQYVLWLEVVLASGELVRFGSRVLKSSSSLNLAGLMVGSEGQLGLFTKVGLRIVPLPKARKTGMFVFDDLEAACEAAVAVRKAGVLPNMLELMDETTTTQSFEYTGRPSDVTPRGNLVLVECDGTPSSVEEEFEIVESVMREHGPSYTEVSGDADDREVVLQARKNALPALSGTAPTTCIEDCTLKITDIPRVVHLIQDLDARLRERGVRLAVFGHVGDGNLHPTFLFDGSDPAQRKAFEDGLHSLYEEIVTPLGGSITGEHGVGTIKAPFLALEHGNAVGWMRRVKELFDPGKLLNPGKGKGTGPIVLGRGKSPQYVPFRGPNTSALQCMRCGFCVRSCPSWLEFRVEQASPRGRINFIRGVLNKEIAFDVELQQYLLECTLCGACATKCPAGIPTNEVFEQVRSFLHGFEEKA